jgi:hypothetical protein
MNNYFLCLKLPCNRLSCAFFLMFYACSVLIIGSIYCFAFILGFFPPSFFLFPIFVWICLQKQLIKTSSQETTNSSFSVPSVSVKAWVCWLYKGSHKATSSASPILVKPATEGFTMYKDLKGLLFFNVLKIFITFIMNLFLFKPVIPSRYPPSIWEKQERWAFQKNIS